MKEVLFNTWSWDIKKYDPTVEIAYDEKLVKISNREAEQLSASMKRVAEIKQRIYLRAIEEPVDPKLFYWDKGSQKKRRDPDKLTLLTVGRVYAPFMEEFCKLSTVMKNVTEKDKGTPEFDCVVVGKGTDLIELKKHYPLVHFLGAMEDKDLALIYKCADVFVLTDQTNLVITQSLMSGLPVVVPQNCPNALVFDGINGYEHRGFDLPECIRKAAEINPNQVIAYDPFESEPVQSSSTDR